MAGKVKNTELESHMIKSLSTDFSSKHYLNKTLAISLLIFFSPWFAGCKSDNDAANSSINLDRTWSSYKGDEASTSYSPLDEINVSNVGQLKNAWTFQMNDLAPGEEPVSSQGNPIIVDGVMFANSGKQTVYAIDAATGKEVWACQTLEEGTPSAASRGVTIGKKETINESSILQAIP